MKKIVLISFVVCLIASKNSNATFWIGADGGINSYFGLLSEIDFFQNRLCTFIHLDIENIGGGYAAFAYKIPIKIAFLPAGLTFIAAGGKNNFEAGVGVYAGLRFELKKITFYVNSYYTPKTFDSRRLQHFNADAGISFAIFDILRGLFSEEYIAE